MDELDPSVPPAKRTGKRSMPAAVTRKAATGKAGRPVKKAAASRPAPPPAEDDSPLVRLRQAAARMAAEEGAGARARARPPAHSYAPPPSPPAPPPPPASPPREEPRPVPSSPPSLPVGPHSAPTVAVGRGPRWPSVGIAAGVLVLLVVAGGLVATRDDDSTDDGARPDPSVTSTVAAERPLVTAESLYAVPGYTFTELAPGVLEAARRPFDSRPGLNGMLRDLSGRSVLREEIPFAGALVYQFSTRFTSVPDYQDQFFQGVTDVASSSAEITVDGLRGVYYEIGTTYVGVLVLKDNAAVLVQGPPSTSRSRLEQVASGVLANVP